MKLLHESIQVKLYVPKHVDQTLKNLGYDVTSLYQRSLLDVIRAHFDITVIASSGIPHSIRSPAPNSQSLCLKQVSFAESLKVCFSTSCPKMVPCISYIFGSSENFTSCPITFERVDGMEGKNECSHT
jgi:hypothetical protein